jgi:hypothetical protein
MSEQAKKKAKKAYNKDWRETNREHILETQRAYDERRKEERKEKRKLEREEREEEEFWKGPALNPDTLYSASLTRKVLRLPIPPDAEDLMGPSDWFIPREVEDRNRFVTHPRYDEIEDILDLNFHHD